MSVIPIFHSLNGSNLAVNHLEEVLDLVELTSQMQCICDEYIKISQSEQTIIVFPEMIEYLVKVSRTLSLDSSHVCLVGLSKCGKKVVIKLAIYLLNCESYFVRDSVEIKEWN